MTKDDILDVLDSVTFSPSHLDWNWDWEVKELDGYMIRASFKRRFIVCPMCGNKRCPKASWHENACTDSNEPGQPGSFYGPQEFWPKESDDE